MMPKTESVRPPRKSVNPLPLATEDPSAARARYLTPALLDIEQLDAARDADGPDASVARLATHAAALAQNVRTHADALALAKVTAADAARLDALVALLREREGVWQACLAKYTPGVVAKLRAAVVAGNRELYGALRAFVDDAATQSALDAIPEEGVDDDLDAGTDRLVALAREHAGELAGTEVTHARVEAVAEALARFRAARAGSRGQEGEGTSEQALDEAARQAKGLRNRAYWALATLDRTVCKRARFRFRDDAARRALFTAYTAQAARPRKKSTP